jgi:hypothetical protein
MGSELFRRPVSASQDSVMLVRFGVACGYGALSVGCCFELGSLQSSVVSADALVALVTVSGSRCGMSRNGGRMYPAVLLPCSKAWSQHDVCGWQSARCISEPVSVSMVVVLFVYG